MGVSLVHINSILSECQGKNLMSWCHSLKPKEGNIYTDFFDSSAKICYNVLYFYLGLC